MSILCCQTNNLRRFNPESHIKSRQEEVGTIFRDSHINFVMLPDFSREHDLLCGTVQRLGGSCRLGKDRTRTGMRLESMPEPGSEPTIVDRAANLEEDIRTSSRPSHLLRFVHAAVDQEVRRAFGDRRPDTQAGAIAPRVVDEPVVLAAEIPVNFMQCMPRLARGYAFRAMTAFAFEDRHDLTDPVDAEPGIAGLAVPDAPAQSLDFRDNHGLRVNPVRLVDRQTSGRLLRMLQSHRDVKPIQNWWFRDPGGGRDGTQTGTAVRERGDLGVVGSTHGFKTSPDQRGDVSARVLHVACSGA